MKSFSEMKKKIDKLEEKQEAYSKEQDKADREMAQKMTEHQKRVTEIWDLIRETRMDMKKSREEFDQIRQDFQETDRKFQETDRKFQETDRMFKETDKKFQETDREFQETKKLIERIGKQLGEIGNKLGSYTEGMAYPSLRKILRENFYAKTISKNMKSRKDGQSMEIDVFGYSNSEHKLAVIVETKSHLRVRDIDDLIKQSRKFSTFFPEFADKKLYLMLAAVQVSDSVRQKALKKGIFLANISDEAFTLDVPDGFEGTDFSQ